MKSGTSVGLSELSFTQRCGFDFYYLNTELCEKQEDLLDLKTALLKFNYFLSTTVATQ